MNISYRLIRTRAGAYQGVRNVRFSKNLACSVFLLPPFFEICLFALLLTNYGDCKKAFVNIYANSKL